MRTRTIRQNVKFDATPREVYELLMDQKKHAEFTGGKCKIVRKVGGKIDIYDGYITGKNLELLPDRKIVQTWRPQEDCWPEDHFSKVTFLLKKTEHGSELRFTQNGVPVECGDRFDTGWVENYWSPMREWLKSRSK